MNDRRESNGKVRLRVNKVRVAWQCAGLSIPFGCLLCRAPAVVFYLVYAGQLTVSCEDGTWTRHEQPKSIVDIRITSTFWVLQTTQLKATLPVVRMGGVRYSLAR